MNSVETYRNKYCCNQEQLPLYDKVTSISFKKLAKICGITDYCDIKTLFPYLKNKDSLLEVGAGYGRVIDGLQYHNYPGKIAALEIIPKLCKKLRKKFPTISVYERNALYPESFMSMPYFDAILMMWGSILDFSEREQQQLLKNFALKLNKSGIISIDLPVTNPAEEINHYNNARDIIKKYNEKSIIFNIPTTEQIAKFALEAKLKIKEIINYKSSQSGDREIYILTHLL
jgi:SAM-dependent methyltransferase